jgi:LPS sulfotransferase NodH
VANWARANGCGSHRRQRRRLPLLPSRTSDDEALEVPALTAANSENPRRCASVSGTKRPVFFIVFGHQRTGSTLLASRLASHPNICCYEEVFLPSVDSSPSMREWLSARRLPQSLRVVPGARASFLSSLFDVSNIDSGVGAAGFKVMYDQMSLWPTFSYLIPIASGLLQDPGLRNWLRDNRVLVLHMLRRNHLKILVSQKLAAQSGRFHSRNPSVADMTVFISLLGLKPRLRRIELAERAARRCIAGLPSIEIYYEDYTGSGDGEDDARLCRALGQDLPMAGLTSPLRKVSSDDLRDTVANYDEVFQHLSGTRFERFLW